MVMTRSSVGQPKLFVSRSLKWDQRVQKGPEILDFLSISIDAWARLLANKAPSRQSEDDGNARSLLAKTRSPGGKRADPSSERERGHRRAIEQVVEKWATRRLDV